MEMLLVLDEVDGHIHGVQDGCSLYLQAYRFMDG
jgi:hypothetical protein